MCAEEEALTNDCTLQTAGQQRVLCNKNKEEPFREKPLIVLQFLLASVIPPHMDPLKLLKEQYWFILGAYAAAFSPPFPYVCFQLFENCFQKK